MNRFPRSFKSIAFAIHADIEKEKQKSAFSPFAQDCSPDCGYHH
jgi:hypothetical protein